jgi:hypothetical protein
MTNIEKLTTLLFEAGFHLLRSPFEYKMTHAFVFLMEAAEPCLLYSFQPGMTFAVYCPSLSEDMVRIRSDFVDDNDEFVPPDFLDTIGLTDYGKELIGRALSIMAAPTYLDRSDHHFDWREESDLSCMFWLEAICILLYQGTAPMLNRYSIATALKTLTERWPEAMAKKPQVFTDALARLRSAGFELFSLGRSDQLVI